MMVFPIGGILGAVGGATSVAAGVGELVKTVSNIGRREPRPIQTFYQPSHPAQATAGAPAPQIAPSGAIQQAQYINGLSRPFGAPMNGNMGQGRIQEARIRLPGMGQGSAPDVLAVPGGGLIRPIIARARAYTGVPMTSRKLVGLIRQFGWEVVADWTGLTVQELLTVYQYVTRRRRTRWTSRDKSRARRYIGMLERYSREYSKLRGRAAPRRRSTSTAKGGIVNVK